MFHEEVLGSKQRAELETNVDLPEERRMHLNKLPWKKVGKRSRVYKGRVAGSEWTGRQAGDRLRWALQISFWGMNKGSGASWKKGVSVERMCNGKKNLSSTFYVGINSALPFIGVSYLLTKNTSLWSPNIWKLFPTPPSSSQILAGCPRIQLNSDTIYQEICIRYHRLLSHCGAGEDSWESLGQQGYQTNLKGNQSWIFIGGTDAEAEVPILWPCDAKSRSTRKDPDAGKDWRQEEKGTTEGEMVGWHHWLNGHEFE